MDADALFTLALNRATPNMLSADQVRRIPAHVLGGIAMEWNDQGRPDKTVALLQALFQQPQGLNERHDPALDALLDAMLQLGKEHERRDFLRRMVDHPNKLLATTARCRLVTMLADQGDYPAAWKLFQDTTRFHSNDPQLWQLELTLLLSQGRDDEAKLRAPLLAAQARKVGLDELAHMLLKVTQEGTGAIYERMDAEASNDPLNQEWLALCNSVPAALDAAAVQALYGVEQLAAESTGGDAVRVSLSPTKALTALERKWQRQFAVGKPALATSRRWSSYCAGVWR